MTQTATASALAVIAAQSAALNAFITVVPVSELRDGIPLAVKDLFDTAGLRTTYGSRIYAQHVPAVTAEAVVRLESAGYVIVGKTNLHEFGYGVTSENPHYGAVRHPDDQRRIAGGSSGGSAVAVACGMADAALGTDTGGSIRIPAALCGVAGFKPTYGVVPTDGVFPLAPSFDHVGPIGRTVRSCAELFSILARRPVAKSVSLNDVRIGILGPEYSADDESVASAVQDAIEMFPRRRHVDFPGPYEFNNAKIVHSEAIKAHASTFPSCANEYGADVAARLTEGVTVSADAYDDCQRRLASFRERWVGVFEEVDVLALPTVPVVAPLLGSDLMRTRALLTRNVRLFNSLGWPALAVPCRRRHGELPASVQLVGRPGDDLLIMGLGITLDEILRTREELGEHDYRSPL